MANRDGSANEASTRPQQVVEGRKGHQLDGVVSIPNLPTPTGPAPGVPTEPTPSAPAPTADKG
jgi:hypothetical protein